MVQEQSWVDRAEYPFQSRYWPTEDGDLHYVDEGRGDPIVFVHGNPTWSFMYRKLIEGLRSDYRCVALDHLGFGLSDKPFGVEYTPQLHAKNLTDLITGLGLKDITLVIHDWGGPIGMAYALNHPRNIKRLVVFNTHFWSLQGVRGAEIFSRLVGGPVGRWLCRRFNAFPRFVMPKVYGRSERMTKAVHQHYLKPFPNRRTREGSWSFAKAIIGESEWLASLWSRRDLLQWKPVRIFWGLEDPVGTEDKLHRWETTFVNHETTCLPVAGHFVPEQLGASLVKPVREFLTSASRLPAMI